MPDTFSPAIGEYITTEGEIAYPRQIIGLITLNSFSLAPNAFVFIGSGIVINRFEAVTLLLATGLRNPEAADGFSRFRYRFDGGTLHDLGSSNFRVPAGCPFMTWNVAQDHPLTPGQHTVELSVENGNTPSVLVNDGRSLLTVYETSS